VFLDGPNGCSKAGFSIKLAAGAGLQQLYSAICSKAQLHKVTLYGLSSKQRLEESNLCQVLEAEAAVCGGTAVLVAAAGEQQELSEAALQLPGLTPVPWGPGERATVQALHWMQVACTVQDCGKARSSFFLCACYY
jgi:hypothetical protein